MSSHAENMYPLSTVVFILLLLAICQGVPFLNRRISSGTSQGQPVNDALGAAAEAYLMNGASLFMQMSQHMTIYKRPGNKDDAVAEFYFLKPTNIRHSNEIQAVIPAVETELHGQVGQRKIILHSGKECVRRFPLQDSCKTQYLIRHFGTSVVTFRFRRNQSQRKTNLFIMSNIFNADET